MNLQSAILDFLKIRIIGSWQNARIIRSGLTVTEPCHSPAERVGKNFQGEVFWDLRQH